MVHIRLFIEVFEAIAFSTIVFFFKFLDFTLAFSKPRNNCSRCGSLCLAI